MVALSPRSNSTIPDHVRLALLVLYQTGLAATAFVLIVDHLGRCTAVFNCMVLLAADLFRAMIWPLYWLAKLVV